MYHRRMHIEIARVADANASLERLSQIHQRLDALPVPQVDRSDNLCCWIVSFWVRGVKTFCTLSLLLAKVGSNQARRMLHRQESSFYKSPYLQSHATIEVNLTDDVAIARAFMPSANAMPFLQTAGSATWICRRSSRRPEEVPLEKKKTTVVPLSFSRYHFSDSPMLYCRGAALAWG